MSARQWLLFIAATVAIRWVSTRWFPHADAYLLAGLALGIALLAIFQRSRRYAIEDLRNREIAPEDPAAPAAPATPEAPTGLTRVFAYPAGNRFRSLVLLLLTGVFGIGFLLPLALGREDDPANGWVLFIMGVIFLALALMHVRVLQWVGRSVLISREGLTLRDPSGRLTHLSWTDLVLVRQRRFPASLTFLGQHALSITVFPEMIGYHEFLALVSVILSQPPASASDT